ncbi:hypothetical protein GCM10010468_35330 [Actinocorallia longicatena]|uniref:Cell envelope-related transcriptional attenuator domain-containing protein n=2 Tax=Actinocorallia longicatena TaxID=111803 RepID=A0ABP6QAK0_9ACTN
MNLLREFGRELEHEPPASLARQRNRLTGKARRPFFARPGGFAVLGAVAAVTAAAVLVPTVVLNGHAGRTLPLPPGEMANGDDLRSDLNVLVLGTDSREGANGAYGRKGPGERSDTIMVAHIPADGTKVRVVSLPRDLMVRLPSCRTTAGGTSPGHTGLINEAYTIGGAACSKKAVESLTGLRLNHVVEIDFTGLKKIVDAVGGVEITLPKAVDDRGSGLKLPAGRHLVRGETALAYVRARHGLGDGSDLGRIERQQLFVKSLLGRAAKVRTDPVKMTRLVRAFAAAVRSDGNLTVQRMLTIAASVGGAEDAAFSTVPWAPYPADPSRIQLRQPQAERLFTSLR